MKALITAGGKGTRLRPLTHTTNKHLIPIGNKPMIEYAIESVRDAGITEIGITYNEGVSELVAHLGYGERFGVAITYIHQASPIGLADCVRVARDFIGDEDFVFFLGDNILASGITSYVREFEESEAEAMLLLAHVPDPQRFGVPQFDEGGKIIRVIEKPQEPTSDMAVTGIYFYRPTVFDAFERDPITPSARGELEISDLHQWLLDHGYTIHHQDVTGWWKDTGTVSDLLEANRVVLHGLRRAQSTIGEGTLVDEYSHIGDGVSVGRNCTIEGAWVSNSIILDNTRIQNISLEGSLIGNNVEILGRGEARTVSLTVGDNSKLRL